MRKKKVPKESNTRFALIFVGIVSFIILISLTLKLVLLIGQSRFDDSRRFTIAVHGNRDSEAISFSASPGSISRLKVEEKVDVSKIGQYLEIPVDGLIISESLDLNQKTDVLFLKFIWNFRKLQTNLTIIDLVKLFVITKTTPENLIEEKNIPKDLETGKRDLIVGRYLKDTLVEKDSRTIQIINGTNLQGLGNRLARLITNMGGNVIIVTSSSSPQKTSTISYVDKTFTVERLVDILGFKETQITNKNIADISIIIGEDKLNSLPF